MARVNAARNRVTEAFSPLLPSVGSLGAWRWARIGPNTFPDNPKTGQSPLSGDAFQSWAGILYMSYEIDFWGRLRRGLEGATADEAAVEEDRKTVEITLISEVTQTYFDLGQAEADLAVALEAVRLREETVRFVKERFEGGVVPELDLHRARSELERTRAQVFEARRLRALAEHRLAVLLGRMPTLHFGGHPPAEFDLPPELPVGMPATLLERRPDVQAAELRLRAANARVGQSIANFFPRVSILGALGEISIDVWTVAKPGSLFYAAGPSIDLPIFQGGRTYAQMKEAEAHTDEATAAYWKTVLTAFREVADAIVGIQARQSERDAQQRNVVESEKAVQLVTEQYEKGVSNYLGVLDAQRTLLVAKQSLIQAQRDLLSSIVQLEKALGGGWTQMPEEDGKGDGSAK